MKEELLKKFRELYGEEGPVSLFFAPGRVNLIGEHTDYNGGHVFPCALSMGIYAAARKRKDKKIRFYSMTFDKTGVVEKDLKTLFDEKEPSWVSYPQGVMWALAQRSYKLDTGLDLAFCGDIPNGSGLSSSAAMELATGVTLRELYGFSDLSLIDLALIGQTAENKFNGMNCGIMDQFASAMGKKDHAIFLDTETLEYEYAPVKLPEEEIVIVNSCVKHSLVDSAYNKRRQECETALLDLQKVLDISSLGELSEEDFEANKSAIQDPVCRKRAKHAVYENQRTIRALKALHRNDIVEFGRLINESHCSLRDDFEVSCKECDILAETAWSIPGVFGARITGGGFGGCVVCIVKRDALKQFSEVISQKYHDQTGHTARIYVAQVGDGARWLETL